MRDRVLTRLLITLLAVTVFRIGQNVPAPGVNASALTGTDLGVIDLLTGGALLDLSVFALGVLPVMVAGSRRLALLAGVLMAAGVVAVAAVRGGHLLHDRDPLTLVTMAACIAAGAALTLRLADLITSAGVGDGISILLFAQIAAVLPSQLNGVRESAGVLALGAVLLIALAFMVVLPAVDQAQRRVPVQYRRDSASYRRAPGAAVYIPIRLNQAGLSPIMYALVVLYAPLVAADATGLADPDETALWFVAALPVLVVLFAYARIAVAFDPNEVSTGLWKSGGFVPGIRPGRNTAEYLAYVRARVNAPAPLFLGLVTLAPLATFALLGIDDLALTGTSLLIALCVAVTTVKHTVGELLYRRRLNEIPTK